jgi:hypothetical protein
MKKLFRDILMWFLAISLAVPIVNLGSSLVGRPFVREAFAADVVIDAGASSSTARGMRAMVWTSTTKGYFFFIDADADFFVSRTTDGGQTWGSAIEIDTDTTITALTFDVWYDQWTPGDTGTKIHIWWVQIDVDDILYRNLDTSSDTLSSQTTPFAGGTAAASRSNFVSGTKARGGNLYVVGTIDAAAECSFARSTDGGATWGARTSPLETCADQGLLFPGNETDTQDIWMLYDDVSADQLSLKTHDDSANSNSESATLISFVENTTDLTGAYGFSGSIRHSDNHLIAAIENSYDLSTSDFVVYDINGTGSVTQKTDISTNIDDQYYPSVFIDKGSNSIYVAYIGKRDGTDTLATTAGVYYTKSTNGGTSWTSGDTAYSETSADWAQAWAPLSGPRFSVAWRDISDQRLLTNYNNSLIATFDQIAFRLYEDGTESGSSPIDSQDTDITRNVDSDSNLHLRFRIDETKGISGDSTDDWQLQYSKNAASYTDVTSGSSNAKGFNSALTDGGATTNRATNGITDGTGSFVAGEISEDGLIDDHQLTASNFTEHLYTLTLVSADLANNDTLDFRILRNGSTITYSQTPTITASKTSVGPTTEDVMRHGNWFSSGIEQYFFWAD